MTPIEYARMTVAEETHWWYRGLRICLEQCCVSYLEPGLGPARILDMGCGTGGNLGMLRRVFAHSEYIGGFDSSEIAIAYAHDKLPSKVDLYCSDLCSPEFHCSTYTLLVSCDVLYMVGMDRAFAGFCSAVDRLVVGGLLVLHLPARQWFYSEHDRAVGTVERYSQTQVAAFIERLGLRTQYLSYRVTTLLPPIITRRAIQSCLLRGKQLLGLKGAQAGSDLEVPGAWLNRICLKMLVWESQRMASGRRFPIGNSIIAVAQKEN